MILVNCGCCEVASGYGCAVWYTYGATGVQGTGCTTPVRAGAGATCGGATVVNGFVLLPGCGGLARSPWLAVRGLEYVRTSHCSLAPKRMADCRRAKNLGDYNCLAPYCWNIKEPLLYNLPILIWYHQLFGRETISDPLVVLLLCVQPTTTREEEEP